MKTALPLELLRFHEDKPLTSTIHEDTSRIQRFMKIKTLDRPGTFKGTLTIYCQF